MKRPAFQFYPGDWLKDLALRLVSVGARGTWMDMICLMHQAEPYGYLKVNGKVILSANLAKIVGASPGEMDGYLDELESAGVFSRDDQGCIFSRRMIRDEMVRESRAAGGKLGGNPALKDNLTGNHKVNLPPNLADNLSGETKVNQKPTPSSSSSSSSSSSKIKSPSAGKSFTYRAVGKGAGF